MDKEVIILIAEDDIGHATLVQKNLKRAGVTNDVIHCKDGEEVLDFLLKRGDGPHYKSGTSYLLLLDILMPKVNGVEVLRQLKSNEELKKMPVIMLTTTDDPREIENCYNLGCSNYIAKPIDYDNFVEAIQKLGLFLKVVEMPTINGDFVHD